VRKIVEVFVNDRRRAAYPVVLQALDRPSDEEFVEQVRRQMRVGPYTALEVQAARFIVRDTVSA
jgi:hypothetical protein